MIPNRLHVPFFPLFFFSFLVFSLALDLAGAVSASARARADLALALRLGHAARGDQIAAVAGAAGAGPLTTVDPARFPEEAWRACPDDLTGQSAGGDPLANLSEALAQAGDSNVWRTGRAPVLVEAAARGACLVRGGRPDATTRGGPSGGGPVLTWVKSAPPARCYSEAERERAASAPGVRPNVTEDVFLGIHKLTVFWPSRDCGASACPLVVHLHGFSDHATTWGYPQLMMSNESTCAAELGAILLSPDLTLLEELLTTAVPPSAVDLAQAVVIPMIESFIAKHAELIDPRRVYLAGVSNGGHFSLISGLLRPDLFSLVVATDCYLKPSFEWAEQAIQSWGNLSRPVRLSNMVVTYGGLDTLTDFSYQLDSLSNLSKVDAFAERVDLQLRVYEGRTHGTWNTVFLQWPDLYDVMFTQEAALGGDDGPSPAQ